VGFRIASANRALERGSNTVAFHFAEGQEFAVNRMGHCQWATLVRKSPDWKGVHRTVAFHFEEH
jgi:hypothetical protein